MKRKEALDLLNFESKYGNKYRTTSELLDAFFGKEAFNGCNTCQYAEIDGNLLICTNSDSYMYDGSVSSETTCKHFESA